MKKVTTFAFIFSFSFLVLLKIDFLYAIDPSNQSDNVNKNSIVDCSGITQEDLLVGIFNNHQLNSLYDQVSRENITRSSIKDALLKAKNGMIENLGSIEVGLDLSHWPKVDAGNFDRRSQMPLHSLKTLASIVARIRNGELDVKHELTQEEIDQAIWKTYFSYGSHSSFVSGNAPESTLLKGLESFKESGFGSLPKIAVDIGCGRGRDTKALLNAGWKVFAIDFSEEALAILRSEIKSTDKLHLVRASFEELDLDAITEKAALINSSYTLPYAGEGLQNVWNKIVRKLDTGGIFTGQFFGKRDGFTGVPGIITQTKDEVMRLFKNFDMISFDEKEWDGKRVNGDIKHWQVFDVVAKKRGLAPKEKL